MKKHVVIIRFHYPENHPHFAWRFAYFQALVLPRLLEQTNKDFDIAIWCNPAHVKQFQALSNRIITFGIKPEAEGKIKPGYEEKAKKYFVDFVDWQAVVGLEKYLIQTALDSDDLILRPDYIDFIESKLLGLNYAAHLCSQPYIFHAPTLKTYTCPIQYGPEKGSCFYSIYQPEGTEKYIFLYDDSHLKIGRQFPYQIFIDKPMAAFSVHHANASTKLFKDSKQILI